MKAESRKANARDRYAGRRRRNLRNQLVLGAGPQPGKSGPDPEAFAQLEAQVAQLTEESGQLRELATRQRAEFDNFRKRTLKEKEQIRDAAREDMIARLLPVMDNFERALAATGIATDASSIRDGISMVADQLLRILEAEGLQKLNVLNACFDPNEHEALATEERDDFEDNHICEEMLPGYKFKDKVIRAAMVKVAKAN